MNLGRVSMHVRLPIELKETMAERNYGSTAANATYA